MENKPFLMTGRVIHPSDILQIIVFRSEESASKYPLPNGKTIESEMDIYYIASCFSKRVKGIYSCNDEFITAPPEEKREETRTPTIVIAERRKVFIVHGRDETQALNLQKYLTKKLNLDAEIFEDFNCPSCGVPLNVLISKGAYKDEPIMKIPRTAETIRKALPSDVVGDLTIVEKEQTYHIVPKKYLGKENYWKVMQVVKNLHGEWVRQGKTSYWWVPKTETVEL